MAENSLFSYRTDVSKSHLFDRSHPVWAFEHPAIIDRFWNGRSALSQRGYQWASLTRVASAWNDTALYFYFECWFDTLNLAPVTGTEQVQGLWEYDVVEVFLKPEGRDDYFEIEANPRGQWLAAHILRPRLDVNFDWDSQLSLAADLNREESIWRVFLELPFGPLLEPGGNGRIPETGDVWHLNLFRISGIDPLRDYLSWRPTFTAEPDFHVPAAFGNLFFLD